MSTTARPSHQDDAPGGVLVVHANEREAQKLVAVLGEKGIDARAVSDAGVAIDELVRHRFDVLVLDSELPQTPASELVRVVRAYDIEVPIVVLTDDATGWVGAGVQLVAKPVDPLVFTRTVARGKNARKQTKRLRPSELGLAALSPNEPEELSVVFDRALEKMWLAFQPILREGEARVFGYEALMRSHEKKLATPGAMLGAAESLGKLDVLGRRVRALAAASLAQAPDDAQLFVNLHSRDLLDQALFESSTPLTSLASRVVLEITERANVEDVDDVSARLSILRFHGFRIAVDDLGAGYAGLTSFATVEPEFVKLDMSLVRNLHASPVRRRLVASMVDACRDLGSNVVAEGIESQEELRVLRELGCELFQGYLFAKPAPTFERAALP